MNFDELKAQCLACRRCRLCETRTNVVFGAGSSNADIMLIGEGPGKNEDEQGLPFVGRSGQLLDKLLATVDFSRDKNVFIANIVKCRPPENRDPLPDEWDACLPFLNEQFNIIKPKIVVCLGRIAAQRMIRPDFAVTREHGQWTLQNGMWFTATLHPAALLRNPAQISLSHEDFISIRQKCTELQSEDTIT